jgi:N-acetylneuraminic acid mutarotase
VKSLFTLFLFILFFGGCSSDVAYEDLDLPSIGVSEESGSVAEGEEFEFNAKLSRSFSKDVKFNVIIVSEDGVSNSDIEILSENPILVPAGQTAVSVKLKAKEDAIYDGEETYSIRLVPLSNVQKMNEEDMPTFTMRVIDMNPRPTVNFELSSEEVAETAGSFTAYVQLSHESDLPITVPYTLTGSASPKVDHSLSNGYLVIPPNTLRVPLEMEIYDDFEGEPDEIIQIKLGAPVDSSVLGSNRQLDITIVDDDPDGATGQPSLYVTETNVDEAGQAEITISLIPASEGTVVFDWETADGTAVEGVDYVAVSTTQVVLPPGSSTHTIVVDTLSDNIDEYDETFQILVTSDSATVMTPSADMTILDDDANETVNFASASETVGEGDGTVSFDVSLSASSEKTTVVNYSVMGSANNPSDHNLGDGAVTFAPGEVLKTVSFALNDDLLDEDDEAVLVTLSSADTADIGTQLTHTITITDNDTTPTLTINSPVVTEGSDVVFTFTLSAAAGRDISFDWQTTDNSATDGSDYTSDSGTVTISAGATSANVTISTTDDEVEEPTEDFTIDLSNAVSVTLGATQATAQVNDNDTGKVKVAFASDSITYDESAGAVSVDVNLTEASEKTITVDYTLSGTTANPEDHDLVGATLTYNPGETTKTISWNIQDDVLDEYSETLIITLGSPSNVVIETPSVYTVTITDNDVEPTLSIDDVTVTEGADLVFTVSLDAVAGRDVTFDWSTTNNTAHSGSDFVFSANTGQTISAGVASITLTVPSIQDPTDEADENFTLNIANLGNAQAGDLVGQGVIQDDDAAPTISISDVTTFEGTVATLTVSLSTTSQQDVTFDWGSSAVSATADVDYTEASGTKTIVAGTLTQTINITVGDDVIDEPVESLNVTLSNITNADDGDLVGTIFINDDEGVPTVTISDATITEAGTLDFTVTMSIESSQDITFDWSTNDVNATAGSDYTAANVTGETISAGSTSITLSVPTAADVLDEDDETLEINLSNISGANLGNTQAIGTITDDDAAPTVSIDDVTVAESGTATFTVSLSAVSGRDVSFDWAASNGTAIAASDYTFGSGSGVTISAGSPSTTISLVTLDDSTDEESETFTITLSNLDNADPGDLSGEGTITDDDGAPTISIADASATEGGTLAFTIYLSASSQRTVTVDYATSDGSALVTDDYTDTNGTLTFTPGQTVKVLTVPVSDDALDEDIETMTVTLSNPSNVTASDMSATGTISDNDTPPVLSISDVTITEGDTATVTVSLDAVSGRDVTVSWFTSNNTAVSPTDYTTGSASLTITEGNTSNTFTVDSTEDAKYEITENFKVNLSGPDGASIGDGEGVITITDDDPTPTISIANVSVSEGDATTLTVTLSAVSGIDATFDWATVDVTASAGSDYNSASGSGTIIAGATATTLSVVTLQDGDYEIDETFNVVLSNLGNVDAGATTASVTIPENDLPEPTVTSISPTTGSAGGGTSVTITGTNFQEGASVSVGSACVDITVVSYTTITCTTTASVLGAANVSVANPDGKAGTKLSAFSYFANVQLSAIIPSRGLASGGEMITVLGSDIFTGSTIKIDGNNCGSINIINPHQATCITPTGTDGARDVQIIAPDLNSDTMVGGYTYTSTYGVWDGAISMTDVPDQRTRSASVWTGTKTIVWGGYSTSGMSSNVEIPMATGGVYDPVADSWSVMSTVGAPTARFDHQAVWTGNSMIIWGGYDGTTYLDDGAIYDPELDSWATVTATGAPTGRTRHKMVWSGDRMIVWGGYDGSTYLNTGATYDYLADTWTDISNASPPSGRIDHTAIWTGKHMIIWGGWNGGALSDGYKYSLEDDTWTALAASGLSARFEHTATWTGDLMVVFGGRNCTAYNTNCAFSDGSRYDPEADSWAAMSASGLNSRYNHSAVWTGKKVLFWGGAQSYTNAGGSHSLWNDGKAYDPINNTWAVLDTTSAPSKRQQHVAVWTGYKMMIWGGYYDWYYNDGAIFDLQESQTVGTWLGISESSAPTARYEHSQVFTGSKVIVWGGWDGTTPVATGGVYDPVSDSWSATTATNAPAARFAHTAVWTGTKMIVWGGQDASSYLGTGSIYDPEADTWTDVSTTFSPDPRSYHSANWTGEDMVIWGGQDTSGYFNSGFVYNYATDSWTAMDTTTAPTGRSKHVASWNGYELLVWGGFDETALSSGAVYDSVADSWSPIQTTNAPTARYGHSAVWTGSNLIVWGGTDGTTYFGDGAKYDLGGDSWATLSSTDAPSGRMDHIAVWFHGHMFVWGGWNGSALNSGATYNSLTDSWTAMVIDDLTPEGRRGAKAVWLAEAGASNGDAYRYPASLNGGESKVLIWGGTDGIDSLNSGGTFLPAK